jgi:excisionase family DNA binding protein
VTELTLTFPDALVELIALRVASLVGRDESVSPWLDVSGAATYLSTTDSGIRSLVKRRAIPFHKVAGRLLFDRAELDEWVKAGG